MKYTCTRPKAPAPCPDPCCPPEPCRCQTVPCPPRPCPSPPPARCYVLPRVVASGRICRRRMRLCLTVSGLPDCAVGPYTLLSVSAAQPESFFPDPVPGCRRMLAHAVIPLICRVRDGCGCIHTGRGLLETDVYLTPSFSGADPWRASPLVQACVQLAQLPCPQDVPSFDACLELLLEAYMVRWEPSGPLAATPACPELPLYPELRCT